MSKDKSLDTVIYHGNGKFSGRHNVPREFIELYSKLEKLDFVNCLGVGRFRLTKKQQGVKIKGFDGCKNSYVVNLIGKKYEQRVFLSVDKQAFAYEHILKNLM